MGEDETFDEGIPNAWMASSPRHPFFLEAMKPVQDKVRKSKAIWRKLLSPIPAEFMTGPAVLRESILSWKSSLKDLWNEVVLLPSDVIYPFSWKKPGVFGWECSTMSDRFDEDVCKKNLKVEEKGSLTITYWSHTHDGTSSNAENIDSVSHDK